MNTMIRRSSEYDVCLSLTKLPVSLLLNLFCVLVTLTSRLTVNSFICVLPPGLATQPQNVIGTSRRVCSIEPSGQGHSLKYSLVHQMWINPPLKIVPNKCTVCLIKNTVSSCFKLLRLFKYETGNGSREPQTGSQKILRNAQHVDGLGLNMRFVDNTKNIE